MENREYRTTARVRILVAIDSTGNWVSAGDNGSNSDPKDWIMIDDLGAHMSYFWIDAEVPIPQEATLKGTVSDA